jgi:hypothetical protein
LPTTAPAPRPSGRYAVGLGPSLDPDAYFDVCAATEDSPKLEVTNVLTGPVPTGMTSGNASPPTNFRAYSPQTADDHRLQPDTQREIRGHYFTPRRRAPTPQTRAIMVEIACQLNSPGQRVELSACCLAATLF